jgi:hypothetical protein
MAEYLYENPDTGKVVSVIQGVHDEHSYEEGGKKFDRVFTIPNASIDTDINPNSKEDFLEKTRNKKGTLGEMMDKSKELSERRKELNGGADPVEAKYFKEYSKKRRGMKHQNDPSKYKIS